MKKDNKINFCLNIFFILLCFACLIPFLLLLSVSFTSESSLVKEGFHLLPKNFDTSAYSYIFQNPHDIINAYKVTLFTTVVSTILSVLFMSMASYGLSRRNFSYKKQISFFLFFSMLFSGGLVPSYILISHYLHLKDSIWVYILPHLVSPYYIFMCRSSFASLPQEIFESAKIDGASEWRIFFRLVIPLSKPVIATVSLLTVLARWNDWFTALLYIQKQELVTLQYLLQRIMKNIELIRNNTAILSQMDRVGELPNNNLIMAMAVVCQGPILLVFPFFQKYFVRGLTVGSVKG